jgi:uncharacterized membrane protein YedE/YeeE
MTEFTPFSAAIGGALIGLAAVWFMAANGRIAGIAGILNRLIPPYQDDALADRIVFIAGLAAGPLIYMMAGGSVVQTVSDNNVLLAAAGLLVGYGSTIGSGCTSGHGVCGLSRLSLRSMVATTTFMAFGMLTVIVVRHLA